MSAAIHIEALQKSFGRLVALDSINVEITQGELFGFIGPDGAGKTTLFRLLATLLLPDSGNAKVLGFDIVTDFLQIRKSIGYMPGKFSLYQDLTVEENLRFFAGIHRTRVRENYHLIKNIYEHIEPFKNRRVGKLSGGMKQKLALSCALIHRPALLLLDEPTTGVDAVSRMEFWEMLKNLKNYGITVVVSTPYMDEASWCNRVALMQKGVVMQIETPSKIISNFAYDVFALQSNNMFKLLHDLLQLKYTLTAYRHGDSIHCVTHIGTTSCHQFISDLHRLNQTDVQVKNITPSIEDCFIMLMQYENGGKVLC